MKFSKVCANKIKTTQTIYNSFQIRQINNQLYMTQGGQGDAQYTDQMLKIRSN